MKTVLTSGTLSDKIAALTVLVQESPLHGLQHLETMINMAKKKGKREAHMASGNKKFEVIRSIPEFRILRLTFHRKSASKC